MMQMPSFTGAIKVVSNTGTLNNGDSFLIAPTISIKTYEGSGSAVIGDFSTTISFISITLVNDPDIIDDSPSRVATVI
jgi:spore germination protein PF